MDLFVRPGIIGDIKGVTCRRCENIVSEKLTEIPALAALPSLGFTMGFYGNDFLNWLFNTKLHFALQEQHFILFQVVFDLFLLLFLYAYLPLQCKEQREKSKS